MAVIVSTIRVCIGVCRGLVCGCQMKYSLHSKWALHHMSEEQWKHYFNEGGEL
mgnify:CR=1 FL=1